MNQKTDYVVGRKEVATEHFDYVRVNERNLSTFTAFSFDEASKYESLEQAQQIVKVQNMMSAIFGNNYEYKVVERNTDFRVLDENGEEEPEQEVPTDTEPTE